MDLLPKAQNLAYSTNGQAVPVSAKSVEKCALFFCPGNTGWRVVAPFKSAVCVDSVPKSVVLLL
jgi:hypothetical protein